MELYIDLIPKGKKSNFTLLIGVISITIPVVYLVLRMMGENEKRYTQLPMMIYLFMYGLHGIVSGLGYSFEKFFGSKYIQIDEARIAFKTGLLTKALSIPWDQIKSIEYKTNWFQIIHTDGSTSKLNLSDLEFKILIEVRDAIGFIAAEKGLIHK